MQQSVITLESIPMASGAKMVFHRISPAKPASLSVVCLHGFTGSSCDFAPLCSEFQRHFRKHNDTIEWLLLDLPGHGQSAAARDPDDYQLAALLDLLDRIAAVAIGPRIAVLGYSMGGRIALHWLLRHQEWQGVLIGTSPGLQQEDERSQRRHDDLMWIDLLMNQGIDVFCDKWQQQPLIQSQVALANPLHQQIAERRRCNSVSGLCSALRNWGTGTLPSLWNQLGKFGGLHFLYGDLDTKFAAITAAMQNKNPDFRSTSIAACGHAPQLENPNATAQTVACILCAETEL